MTAQAGQRTFYQRLDNEIIKTRRDNREPGVPRVQIPFRRLYFVHVFLFFYVLGDFQVES